MSESSLADVLQASVDLERAKKCPNWYSREEIGEWLLGQHCGLGPTSAMKLADVIASNYQLAFEKGFDIGAGNTPQEWHRRATHAEDDLAAARVYAAGLEAELAALRGMRDRVADSLPRKQQQKNTDPKDYSEFLERHG